MSEIINIYISDALSMICVVIFGKLLLTEKSTLTKTKSFILFQTACILQLLVFLCFKGTAKTILMLINNIIFCKLFFNLSISKSIFTSFLCMILFVIVDILELIIITNIFGMNKLYYYKSFANSIIANLITCIVFLMITFILKKPLKRIFNTEISNNTKIIILSIVTLIPILLFFYSFVKTFQFSNNIIQYLVAIVVLAIVLFTLIRQTIENNKLSEEYDKLLEFMTTFENEIEKQRILRHETKNEFLTIRAKICDNQKNKEIVEYIDEILQDKIKVKQEEYAKFGYLPPNGIKGLCYFKVQEAEEKEIKVSLNISKRITKSTIYELNTKEQRDFGRILGVLLDNAIEASILSKEKQLGIEAYVNSNKEFKIIISNTYNNEVNKTIVGKERFSTKGKNRGHGLLLVKHIINKNKIFELKTDIQKEIYTQKIVIKKV